MKAILISEVFPPQVGGSGRWLFEVYRRMEEGSIVIAAGEHPEADEFDREHGLRVTRLPLKFRSWGITDRDGLSQYWQLYKELAVLVKSEQPRAIHCGRVLPEGWLAWMLKLRFGLPYWVFVHGEELQFGLASRQLAWMMRRVFRSASGIVANSENTAKKLEREWSVQSARLRILNPGVDCRWFVPATVNDDWKHQVGWHGRSVILTVGRMEKRKGHDMLIRALPAVAAAVPNVLLAIAGDGPERTNIERLVRETRIEPSVQFLGEVSGDTLQKCYQQCDLFVLANREVNGDFEGFGMVLVEAQACGKPVIAGDSGGTRETMQIGRSGLIADCTRPEPLANAIAELLADRGRMGRMGDAARQWVSQQLDWPRLAERAAQLMDLKARADVVPEPERHSRVTSAA